MSKEKKIRLPGRKMLFVPALILLILSATIGIVNCICIYVYQEDIHEQYHNYVEEDHEPFEFAGPIIQSSMREQGDIEEVALPYFLAHTFIILSLIALLVLSNKKKGGAIAALILSCLSFPANIIKIRSAVECFDHTPFTGNGKSPTVFIVIIVILAICITLAAWILCIIGSARNINPKICYNTEITGTADNKKDTL